MSQDRGMVASAIMPTLEQQGQTNFVNRTHAELDLTNRATIQAFFDKEKSTQAYLATQSEFFDSRVVHNLDTFEHESDEIIVSRMTTMLSEVAFKVLPEIYSEVTYEKFEAVL